MRKNPMRCGWCMVFVLACSSPSPAPGTPGGGGAGGEDSGGAAGYEASSGGAPAGGGGGAGGARASGGGLSISDGGDPDAPFVRPPYEPRPGKCGFEAPAFCDDFEAGPRAESGRSGELEPSWWSGVRGGPWNPPNLEDGYAVGPAILPACRVDLPRMVLPDRDAVVCDPAENVPSRHLLLTAASQNYGLTSYRIRRPFDFRGRTGTLKFDADLTHHSLGGWAAVALGTEPAAAPSFDWEERGSGPRHGVSVEFSGGWCNQADTLEVSLYAFADYVQTSRPASHDCETPHITTRAGALNHVEIYVTADHLEVWASDHSPDGVTFPNFHRLVEADIELPGARAYVNLIVRNHATLKYWLGAAGMIRWDNVGFDGPVVNETREYSVPDSLVPTRELDGCRADGVCRFRGDVILESPGDDSACSPDAACRFAGEGRYVGYVLPRENEAPVTVQIPGVSLAGATSARLVLAAAYPWFEWGNTFPPPTALSLRYGLNGNPLRERAISAAEANAFVDFFPELGGAGQGAGLLNQVIDVNLSDLKEGDNSLELQTKGTWTGDYRAGVTGIDLVITTAR